MAGSLFAYTSTGWRAIASEDNAVSGEAVATEVPAEVRKMVGFIEARAARNDALRATDWTQMADAPLTALEKAAYQTYRQALRDLPSVPGFPDVPWPTLPTIKEGAAGTDKGAVYP